MTLIQIGHPTKEVDGKIAPGIHTSIRFNSWFRRKFFVMLSSRGMKTTPTMCSLMKQLLTTTIVPRDFLLDQLVKFYGARLVHARSDGLDLENVMSTSSTCTEATYSQSATLGASNWTPTKDDPDAEWVILE